jgi:hypothetical protein
MSFILMSSTLDVLDGSLHLVTNVLDRLGTLFETKTTISQPLVSDDSMTQQ